MIVSRRPWFFLLVAIACLLLYEPTPADFRWLNVAMALLSFFWFVVLAAEELLGQRGSGRSQGDER